MVNLIKKIVDFLQEVNTTSTRIVASVLLTTLIVLCTLIMMFFKIIIQVEVLISLCTFVLSMGGLDVIQFTQKRKTFIPESNESGNSSVLSASNRAIGNEHGVEFTP